MNFTDAVDQDMSVLGMVRVLSSHTPGAFLHATNVLVAAVVPTVPDQPVVNMGLCKTRDALSPEALDDVARVYRTAGVTSWSIWVAAHDPISPPPGYEITAVRPAMRRDLAPLSVDQRGSGWTFAPLKELGRVNELAHDVRGLGRALTGEYLLTSFSVYVADDPRGMEYASALGCFYYGRMCSINWAATVPQWRGQGLASMLLGQALRTAKDRGCAHAVLQSTEAAVPACIKAGFTRTFDWFVLTHREPPADSSS